MAISLFSMHDAMAKVKIYLWFYPKYTNEIIVNM